MYRLATHKIIFSFLLVFISMSMALFPFRAYEENHDGIHPFSLVTKNAMKTEFPNDEILLALYAQLNKYLEIKESGEDGIYASVDAAIADTQALIARREEWLSNNYSGSSNNRDSLEDYYFNVALAAIAYFQTSQYYLSAELLSHSLALSGPLQNPYIPVYAGRAFSSRRLHTPVLYGITEPIIGQSYPGVFPVDETLNSGDPGMSRNERDLGLAIRNFSFEYVSCTPLIITISDTYDFAHSGGWFFDVPILDTLCDIFASAMDYGVIHEFEIEFTVNLSEPLHFSKVTANGSGWNVWIQNNASSAAYVYYNSKMSFMSDAINWVNLSDLKRITIPAHSTLIVTVAQNYAATHIAASYIVGSTRYVTYADGLSASSLPNDEVHLISHSKYSTAGIEISFEDNCQGFLYFVAKSLSQNKHFSYALATVPSGSALSWTSLGSISSTTLYPSVLYRFSIQNTGTCAALKVQLDDNYTCLALSGFSSDGTMTIESGNYHVYHYLNLINEGGSGGWNIRVFNPKNYPITVYYNSKMCFDNDAMNWSSLNDVHSVFVSINSSVSLFVASNWFATTVAFSYFDNGHRMITYANGLSSGGGISLHYNML